MSCRVEPSKKLHSMLYSNISTEATAFGNKNEDVAVENKADPQTTPKEVGLLVSMDRLWLRASLDRLVTDSTGEGGLEVKCPASRRGKSAYAIVSDSSFCLVASGGVVVRALDHEAGPVFDSKSYPGHNKIRVVIRKYNVKKVNERNFDRATDEMLIWCPYLSTDVGIVAIKKAIKKNVFIYIADQIVEVSVTVLVESDSSESTSQPGVRRAADRTSFDSNYVRWNTVRVLQQWITICSDPWVLSTVSKGLRVHLTGRPHQLVPPEEVTGLGVEAENLMAAEVLSLKQKWVILEVPPVEGQFLSRLFLVPKKDGTWRPVVNLKPLNQYVVADHFKMEATLDIKDAYFHIPLHQSLRYLKSLTWTWVREDMLNTTELTFRQAVVSIGNQLKPSVFRASDQRVLLNPTPDDIVVPIVGLEDKRQITMLLTTTLSSQLLPPQLLYQGNTQQPAIPSSTSLSPDPHVTAQREVLGVVLRVNEDQPASAMFDVFKAHRCPELLAKVKENHTHAVYVPAIENNTAIGENNVTADTPVADSHNREATESQLCAKCEGRRSKGLPTGLAYHDGCTQTFDKNLKMGNSEGRTAKKNAEAVIQSSGLPIEDLCSDSRQRRQDPKRHERSPSRRRPPAEKQGTTLSLRAVMPYIRHVSATPTTTRPSLRNSRISARRDSFRGPGQAALEAIDKEEDYHKKRKQSIGYRMRRCKLRKAKKQPKDANGQEYSTDSMHPSHVTPYIHTMVYHLPHFLAKYRYLNDLSCESVELKNHTQNKRFHHGNQRSGRWSTWPQQQGKVSAVTHTTFLKYTKEWVDTVRHEPIQVLDENEEDPAGKAEKEDNGARVGAQLTSETCLLPLPDEDESNHPILIDFEELALGKKAEEGAAAEELSDLAKHVMVRGVFSHLKFVFAYYPCLRFSSDQLYPAVWDATGILECMGFHVRAFV
ncbi:hypothetical protein Bbelb_050150 [Branchiostoma belcheri]|nr:hypothetical protein Bbelb_050150 [Branchiostoma belcheri]